MKKEDVLKDVSTWASRKGKADLVKFLKGKRISAMQASEKGAQVIDLMGSDVAPSLSEARNVEQVDRSRDATVTEHIAAQTPAAGQSRDYLSDVMDNILK